MGPYPAGRNSNCAFDDGDLRPPALFRVSCALVVVIRARRRKFTTVRAHESAPSKIAETKRPKRGPARFKSVFSDGRRQTRRRALGPVLSGARRRRLTPAERDCRTPRAEFG